MPERAPTTGSMMTIRTSISLALAAGAGAFSLASAAQAADVGGDWSVYGTVQSRGDNLATVSPDCSFQLAGDQITGTCKSPNSAGPVTGTAEGDNVTWQWAATPTSDPTSTTQINFRGVLGRDGVIRGAMTLSAMPDLIGTFTQKRR
jgi:hypothetical protein